MEEAPTFLHALQERKKEIAIGSAAVVAGMALLIAYFQSGPDAKSYASAEAAFAKWLASPQDEALYSTMKQAIQTAPAVGEKYEATIAQQLINTDKLEEALAMASRSLNRVKGEVPFHAAYAQTTLLIEQKAYQQALENAVALKEQMGQSYFAQFKGGSLLYAHNLIRIACLQQELKNRPGEKAAWEELERFLQSGASISDLVQASFSDKRVDLTQYINERKKSL